MAKSLNPMEAFRREEKKKELKKHRLERQKDKQSKLGSMDPAEIRVQLKALERQAAATPADGPTRKRKQELEDTLRAVVKKQKEMADEERRKQADAPPPSPMSMAELAEANKEKFQNPENSIYYHPTLNPFGAPPPGKPQRYRDGTVVRPAGAAPRGPPRQGRGYQGQPQHRGPCGPPPPRGEAAHRALLPPSAMQQPRVMARRPGKRPPLPRGPPPPGTIQVPLRPPLPSGALPSRPPPPPPAHAQAAGMVSLRPQQPREMMPPSPPHPTMASTGADDTGEMQAGHAAAVDMEDDGGVAPYPATDGNEEDSVIAPYPPPEDDEEMDEEAAERAAESRAQLRSLVPVTLRVQRQVPAPPIAHSASVGSAPPVPAPRRPVPAPPAPAPRPTVGVAPPPPPPRPIAAKATDSSSVSKEFDAFMEEVKELL
ncbi:hypothetical protein PHYPSEUDO_004590 [Phytophthora pseudosyringae]|uniref:Wbp11/ELF5/Saf1 N-terminal domain-containing protein n=1 Tax=Phytophthora pseudosyringae TaxID=221518 RepID=A0A8T1WHC9_9STRA|nr:hypothetical protein PHYPSEUDO_004590 [Phytophthora pseudosyringae]